MPNNCAMKGWVNVGNRPAHLVVLFRCILYTPCLLSKFQNLALILAVTYTLVQVAMAFRLTHFPEVTNVCFAHHVF